MEEAQESRAEEGGRREVPEEVVEEEADPILGEGVGATTSF